MSLEARVTLRRAGSLELDVDLSIPPGRTAALLGPNGAGKSTLVSTVAGLLAVDSGRVALDDRVLDEPGSGVFVPPEDRNIGVVFQDYLLFPHLSALENVAFGLRSRRMSRSSAQDRSREWLARVGLQGMDERRPGDLSGGEAQRVALARALVGEPQALLLDEPLSALDVAARSSTRRLLRQHLEEFPGPRLVITHDPAEAFLLADHIHVIEAGRITQSGSPDDLRLRPVTPYAADLGGANFARGNADKGVVEVEGHRLYLADEGIAGPVVVAIPPTAVAVHTTRPSGSPRNTWETTVVAVERLGARARLRTGEPMPLTVELTGAATDELGLEAGKSIWLAVKATELGVQPDE